MSEHIVPVRVYVLVFLALMVFTVITVYVAYFDLGRLNAIVALSIAVVKATLVVLFFMHVKYSSKLIQVLVVAGVFWLVILLAFTMADYLTRTGWPQPGL